MKRVIIKFKDGTHINIQGDFLAREDEYITAWNGENLVAMVAKELIQAVYISEKGTVNETKKEGRDGDA